MPSATSAPPPSGDVTTNLNFVKSPAPDPEGYYFYIRIAPPEGKGMTNIAMDPHEITIKDLRADPASVSFDEDSVEILSGLQPPSEVDFDDESSIRQQYYPKVEENLLRAVPGAKQVHIFRHALRHTAQPKKYAPAAAFAHIDQTGPAVADRVRRHLGGDAARLLQGRYRLVHYWQSLAGPAYAFPLAFASSKTVPESAILPLVTHLKEFSEDTCVAAYSAEQQWSYLSGASPDEAILMQLFDSAGSDPQSGVKGGRAVHAAFHDKRISEDAPARFSIEVSALVFGD